MATVMLLLGLLASPLRAGEYAWLIDIKGVIGPATADHMLRGLEQAEAAGASLVILRIDTPGGLDGAMRDIIKGILASNIPIASYVAPAGSRAASAGTYILYASHIAAMAPATNLGSATPVQMGAPAIPSLPSEPAKPDGQAAPEPPDTALPTTAMERKITNDAEAYIISLAELRGRNAEWASKAVREGVSVSAEQALALNVIDIIATSPDQLLKQLNGRSLELAGNTLTLDTSDSTIYLHPIDWRSEFLSIITNPNVAYLLMMAGIYGLLLEFYNPGLGIPGVLGAVCLLLALYALQLLPVSYAGLGLIILGIALMTAEAFAPSFGILGFGGIAAFVFGSIMLMDTDLPAYQLAMPMILAFALFSASLLVFGLGMLMRARKQTVVTGLQHLVGTTAVVESLSHDAAMVMLEGELWRVNSDQPLQVDDSVYVTGANGLVLDVRKNTESQHDD
jgi:membrane-bound serine protease (ClpP class)